VYTLVLGFPFWCSSKLGAEAVGYPHVGLTVLCAATSTTSTKSLRRAPQARPPAPDRKSASPKSPVRPSRVCDQQQRMSLVPREGEADPEAGQHATSQPLQDVREAGVRAQSVAQNTRKESDGTEDDHAEKRED
jgi:hypothetical protein